MAYASLAQLKEYLAISSASDDALLTRLLDASTSLIEARCGRRFVSSASPVTVTVSARNLVGRLLMLPDDIRSVIAITSDTGDTLNASNLFHNVPARFLTIKEDAPPFAARESIAVSGVWGYTATPPADIVHACIRVAAWMYRQKDAQTFDLSGMAGAGQMQTASRLPQDVEQILTPYSVSEIMAMPV